MNWNWSTTNDGRGISAYRDGLSLTVKREREGNYWWGVYDKGGKAVEGVEFDEDDARIKAELSAEEMLG